MTATADMVCSGLTELEHKLVVVLVKLERVVKGMFTMFIRVVCVAVLTTNAIVAALTNTTK